MTRWRSYQVFFWMWNETEPQRLHSVWVLLRRLPNELVPLVWNRKHKNDGRKNVCIKRSNKQGKRLYLDVSLTGDIRPYIYNETPSYQGTLYINSGKQWGVVSGHIPNNETSKNCSSESCYLWRPVFTYLKLLMAKFGLLNFFGPGNPDQ